jgi:hypothetical protein
MSDTDRNATLGVFENHLYPDMPAYKCHKVVRAARITTIEPVGQHDLRLFFHSRFNCKPVGISRNWFENHHPTPGGYFVVYEDGYTSFSPRQAFEAGYSRLEEPAGNSDNNTGIGVDIPPLPPAASDLGRPPSRPGLRPRPAVLKARRREIECAIGQCCNQGVDVPADWVKEYVSIVKETLDEKRRTDV